MKIAVLDDYLLRSQTAADWSPLAGRCEVTVFDKPIGPDDAARVLEPFDIICPLRERMQIPKSLVDRLPNLKMIAVTGLYNRTLDVAAATARGIVVSYTDLRGTYRNATAELTWGLILSVARHIPHEAEQMRKGGWQRTVGFTLMGRTLGLVGLGRQARRVLPMAQALQMKVMAWSPNLTPEAAAELGVTRVEKGELFSQSDVVSLHLVLSERSRGIIGAPEFALMKKTAILVNTARGGLIDENALIDALRERRLGGAGLDVFAHEPLPDNHPLRALPNVVLTPHQGHNVEEFYQVAYTDVVENIAAFLDGRPIRLLTAERNRSQGSD